MLINVSGIDQLMQLVVSDKQKEDSDSFVRNRYPLRFVLFNNFADCTEFVSRLMDEGVMLKSVEEWMDSNYPDILVTYNMLSQRVRDFVQQELSADSDCIIAPFSELARFYENEPRPTFEALLRSLKGIEAVGDAWKKHQRVYIPIVGLDGKMQAILPDTQITIWKVKTETQTVNYRTILTDETYDVAGLDERFSIARNAHEWLQLWKNPETNVKPEIICTSEAILANSHFAQPDNAFDYDYCTNVHDFLVKGLRLDFGELPYKDSDDALWRELAQCIDVSKAFDFDEFVCNQFAISNIDDYKAFIKIWFDYATEFERWLLGGYFQNKHSDYISAVLKETPSYKDSDFFQTMALRKSSVDSEMKARLYCLNEAAAHGIRLRTEVECLLRNQDIELAKQQGFVYASRFFTAISEAEKKLAVLWAGEGHLTPSDVKHCFPALTSYMEKSTGTRKTEQRWVLDYIDAYKKAKLRNDPTDEINGFIGKSNKDEVTFYNWYNQFSTTRTLLQGRSDIQVYYWIDGLGIDWIPFITSCVERYNSNGVYLNEVMIARASLPTVTSVNKAELQMLSAEDIGQHKIGDLDAFAHQSTNTYPDTIIKEMEVVASAIDKILQSYNGSKIAIVSDHGLTYLSQRSSGLNLSGIEPHHHGRIAERKTGKAVADSSYTILDDGKTLCALKHTSLGAKTPEGLGAHGGCTPEEVLVPIFIISSQKGNGHWSAQLVNPNVSANNPVVEFTINNLPLAVDIYIEYAGKRYELDEIKPTLFKSKPLILAGDCKAVVLHVGTATTKYPIDFTLAVDMNDNMFDF